MAKYLLKAAYTVEGTRGLLKEGGSSRRSAIKKLIGELGGKLEAFYYTLGDEDAIVIVDLPDTKTVTALSLAVNSAGGVSLSTTPLITPEEIDAACKMSIGYRAPGA